jgi:antitoxin component YwqK of YwqJK toxin-antitoxin module
MKYNSLKNFTRIAAALVIFFISGCGNEEPSKKNYFEKDGTIYVIGSNELYSGKIKEETGGRIIEYSVIDGKREGTLNIYYANGKTAMTGEMKNNKNNGEWKYYYKDGTLESKGNFHNNLPNGIWYYYYESGAMKEKGEYSEGKRIGEWIIFSESGDTLQTKFFNLNSEIE